MASQWGRRIEVVCAKLIILTDRVQKNQVQRGAKGDRRGPRAHARHATAASLSRAASGVAPAASSRLSSPVAGASRGGLFSLICLDHSRSGPRRGASRPITTHVRHATPRHSFRRVSTCPPFSYHTPPSAHDKPPDPFKRPDTTRYPFIYLRSAAFLGLSDDNECCHCNFQPRISTGQISDVSHRSAMNLSQGLASSRMCLVALGGSRYIRILDSRNKVGSAPSPSCGGSWCETKE